MKVYAPTFSTGASPKSSLVRAFDRKFLDHLNEEGGGTLSLQIDDADVANIEKGDHVRCFIDGTCRFSWVVKEIHTVEVSQDEAVGQVKVYSGPGFAALLNKGVIFPAFGDFSTSGVLAGRRISDQRVFNFASRVLDHSGWDTDNEEVQLGSDSGGNWPGFPKNWFDQTAYWVWAPGESQGTIDPGDLYLRQIFTLTDAAQGMLHITADDAFEIWIDEVMVHKDGSVAAGIWANTTQVQINLDAGEHIFAVKCTNGVYVGFQRAGVIWSFLGFAEGGAELGDPIVNSHTGIAYVIRPAAPPGMTIGEIVNVLYDEAVTRGLANVQIDVSDTVDADAVSWPSAPDLTFGVGLDLFGMLKQLAEMGYADFRVADPRIPVVKLYQEAGTDLSGSITLRKASSVTDSTCHLTALDYTQSIKSRASSLLIRCQDGYLRLSSGTGEYEETFLTFGDLTAAQAVVAGEAYLDHTDDPLDTTVGLNPVGEDLLFVDYQVADWVSVEIDGTPVTMRVRSGSCSEDRNGNLTLVPELALA